MLQTGTVTDFMMPITRVQKLTVTIRPIQKKILVVSGEIREAVERPSRYVDLEIGQGLQTFDQLVPVPLEFHPQGFDYFLPTAKRPFSGNL